MSDQEKFTLKEILIRVEEKLDKHIEKTERRDIDIDARLDRLEDHKATAVSIAKGSIWVIGIVGGIFFFIKDILEIL